jgi:hypothetical protein
MQLSLTCALFKIPSFFFLLFDSQNVNSEFQTMRASSREELSFKVEKFFHQWNHFEHIFSVHYLRGHTGRLLFKKISLEQQ